MKNQELYNRTVDILVDAYFKDTLVCGDYCACAVGNMIAANMEIKMIDKNGFFEWEGADGKDWYNAKENYDEIDIPEIAMLQIKSTGYSPAELWKIEKAFEYAGMWATESKDESMFNGLMSVIDVLDEIHENKDEVVTTSTKRRFNKTSTFLKEGV